MAGRVAAVVVGCVAGALLLVLSIVAGERPTQMGVVALLLTAFGVLVAASLLSCAARRPRRRHDDHGGDTW